MRVLLTIFSFVFILSINSCKIDKPKKESIKVISFVGDVLIKNTTYEFKNISMDDKPLPGSIIKTGNNSFVQLLLAPETGILLHENSQFKIEKWSLNKGLKLGNTEIFLELGKSLFQIKKLSKNSNFKVKTKTAVLAIRGTGFIVSAERKKEKNVTSLKVIEGKVEIIALKNNKVSDVIEKGESITVSKKKIVISKKSINEKELKKYSDQLKTFKNEIKKETIKRYKSKVIKEEDKLVKEKKDEKVSEKLIAKKKKKKVPILRTEKAIKKYYNKLENISLDDGTILVGAVVSQNSKTTRIHTTDGILKIPTDGIKEIKMR